MPGCGDGQGEHPLEGGESSSPGMGGGGGDVRGGCQVAVTLVPAVPCSTTSASTAASAATPTSSPPTTRLSLWISTRG